MTTIRRHPLSAAAFSAMLMLAAVLGPAVHQCAHHGHDHAAVATDHCGDHDHGDSMQAVGHDHQEASHDAETCSICTLNLAAEFAESAILAASQTIVALHSHGDSAASAIEVPANRTRGPPEILPHRI